MRRVRKEAMTVYWFMVVFMVDVQTPYARTDPYESQAACLKDGRDWMDQNPNVLDIKCFPIRRDEKK